MTESSPDSERKSSRRKKTIISIFKMVLAVASKVYAVYRVVSRVISFCREWLD